MTLHRLAVIFARTLADRNVEPMPGDLVVEVTGWSRLVDPDAIGWLIGHDDAPWDEDDRLAGYAPMREVWDVLPLNPAAKLQTIAGVRCQRWENAEFLVVPDLVRRALPALGVEATYRSSSSTETEG